MPRFCYNDGMTTTEHTPKHTPLTRWLYRGLDGSEWIVRAHSEEAAKAAARVAEKKRTGSAAGQIAASSVRRY